MRSNAGTSQEPVIVVAGLGIAALVGYNLWKPWGAIAGPVAMIVAIALFMLIGLAIVGAGGRSSRVKLFDAAKRKASMSYLEWSRLVANATVQPEHRDAILEVASDSTHPMCEPFLCLMLKLGDAETTRRVSEYVAAHPAATRDLVEHAVNTASDDLLERVALSALASPDKATASWAATGLLRRGKTSPDIIRRLADRIEPLLAEWERDSLRKL